MDTCPTCQSDRVHRSRTRSALERLRRDLTGRVPFRCSACGWRGWAFDIGLPADSAGPPAPAALGEPMLNVLLESELAARHDPDLGALDEQLAQPSSRTGKRRRPHRS